MSQIDITVPVSLRDLTDDEFHERYGCDRFTATVLANRLRYTVDHMGTGILYRAFSPIISTCFDFATAICGPPSTGYAMPAVNNGLLVFLGTLHDAVRNAVEEHGPENLAEGDMLICNDPNRVGNHPNDLLMIRPVFAEGELSGFVVIRAHQMDFGGSVPGGFGAAKKDTYENGLVLGPMLLYRAGQPVRSTFSLIFDNARFGAMLLPDLQTIAESLSLGVRLVQEAIDRYGMAAYLGTLRYACDSSAETITRAIGELPDGDYYGQSGIDGDVAGDDEEYNVKLHIAKRGSRIECDLSGTSRQARTCVNGGAVDSKTAIGVALKLLLDSDTPFTSGTFRPVDVVIPPGTFASALPPDGAIFFYWEVESAIMAAVIEALGDAIGDQAIGGDLGSSSTHNANGTLDDGTPWMTMAQCGGEFGGLGGSSVGDGDGYSPPYFINMMAPATEAIESTVPAMIMRKEYIADTSGAGENRGGPSVLKDVLWLTAAEHYSMPMRFKQPSGIGVDGGGTGASGAAWMFDDEQAAGTERGLIGTDDGAYAHATTVAGRVDPETQVVDPNGEFAYFGRVRSWLTTPMCTWRYRTNAGGGWGNPLERDPERVKRDVRDGYVTIDGARRDYGVVVSGDPDRYPERLVIDAEATRAERAARR